MKFDRKRRNLLKFIGGGAGSLLATRIFGPFTFISRAKATERNSLGINPKAPSGLLMDLQEEPLGVRITDHQPRLSWIVPAMGHIPAQSAYHIQLGRFQNMDSSRSNILWDSGRVESDLSTGVVYDGPPLEPNTAYYWRVKTWLKRGYASYWSTPQRLVTEMQDDWSGKPIWAPYDDTDFRNGTIVANVTINSAAASIWFRAQDEDNNYLWQLRAGSPAKLKKHVQINGNYTVLALKTLDINVPTGSAFNFAITMQDSKFTTFINGHQVDVTRNDTYSKGTVGLRNGPHERQVWHSIKLTEVSGKVIFDDNFNKHNGRFVDSVLRNGNLVLTGGRSTLARLNRRDDWLLARTEFQVDDDVNAAWIQASARSPEGARQYVYRLAVNDVFAGVGPVRSFDPDTETRYHTHDITDLIEKGTNAVSALCYTEKEHTFIADIVITYQSGRRQIIGSGDDWRVRLAGSWRPEAGFTGGQSFNEPQEYIDARAEPVGWRRAGFDDSNWAKPVTASSLPGLKPSWDTNITCVAISPQNTTRIGPGHWIVDLGREVIGGLHLEVTADKSQKVEVLLGAELKNNGSVRYHLRCNQIYREIWTLRKGRQRLQHWGYRAFRWIELKTESNVDVTSGLKALVLRLPWHEGQAEFSSSNRDLDRVWEMCRYSIEALRLNVYQDTPARERRPYEGDGLINQISEYNTQRSYSLARYSISYLVRRPTRHAEYHMMTAIMAWRDYMATGDDSTLASNYDLFVKRQFIEDLNADGLVEKSPSGTHGYNADLVDWPPDTRDGYVLTQIDTVVNAWQYAAFDALSKIAGVLDRKNDQLRFAKLARTLKRNLNSRFIAGNGAYVDGEGTQHQSQQATAFPLALGVTGTSDRAAAGQWLAGQPMKSGVYGAQQLLDALYSAHHAKSALALLTSHAKYSWLHMMDDLNATVTMETWDPSLLGITTFCHAWGTAPANTVMRHIAGVSPMEPGASRLRIAPQPDGLDWFKARVPTIRGPVVVAFQRSNRQVLNIMLPPNTEAQIELDLGQLGDLDINRIRVVALGYRSHTSRKNGMLIIDRAKSGQLVVLAH